MRKLATFLLVVVVVAAAMFMYGRRDVGREVRFMRVERQRLVSRLTTNGKVLPAEFTAVRSEAEGRVVRLRVKEGSRVRRGEVVAEVDVSAVRGELASAEARKAQARADLEVYERGGAAEALAEIDNGLRQARLDLEIARREAGVTARLVEKNAATKQELTAQQDRVKQLEAQIAGLEKKRGSLLPTGGREAAEARLKEAEAGITLAELRLEKAVIRSPQDGVIYNLAIRNGAFLRPGDLVGEVGQLNRLKVTVYVDEPELGRVSVGMAVAISWDAAPGESWKGEVEMMPAQIVAIGTRQVGEVRCGIENRDGRLPAGANVNVEIVAEVVENALSIPKEALRREGGKTGVFVRSGDQVRWREVELGTSSLTHVEVKNGLQEGEAVALPAEPPLADGEKIRAG